MTHINLNLITSHRSVNPTRITFPYNWIKADDDTQRAITQAAFESGVEFENIKDVVAYVELLPNPHEFFFLGGFKVDTITAKGITYSKRVLADFDREAACKILKKFFAANAPGLEPEYHQWFERYVNEFMERNTTA